MSEPLSPSASSPPPPEPPQGQSSFALGAASGRATLSLIFGILGLASCTVLAPFAWYFGREELAAIRAGTSPAAGENAAQVGKILGIVGTVLMIAGLVFALMVFSLIGSTVLMGLAGNLLSR